MYIDVKARTDVMLAQSLLLTYKTRACSTSSMVRRCVAAFCDKTAKEGVSLFQFPKDPEGRRIWAEQVRRTRDRWQCPSDSSVLCIRHFEADCFEDRPRLYEQFGIGLRAPKLKQNAVPTLFKRTSSSVCSNDGDSAPRAEQLEQPRRKRLAYEKRERVKVGLIWTCKSSDELINNF